MKKLFLVLLVLLVLLFLTPSISFSSGVSSNFWDTDFYPYFSTAYITTSDNKVPGQEDLGEAVNTGFAFISRPSDNLHIKGMFSYEPAFKESTYNIGTDSLKIESFIDTEYFSLGAQVGRIVYAYGFSGDERHRTDTRKDIINVSTNLWLNNQVLYRYGDGYGFYLRGKYNDFTYSLEGNILEVNKPAPKEDYLRSNSGKTGISHLKTTIDIKSVGLSYKTFEFVYDDLKVAHLFRIEDSFWETYAPFVPVQMRVTGDLDQRFTIKSYMARQWLGNISLSTQYIDFRHIACGSADEYFDAVGYNKYISRTKMYHANITYYNINSWVPYVYYERGWMEKGDIQDNGKNRGWDQCLGTAVQITQDSKFKFQACNIHHTQFLPYSLNSDFDELEKDWNLYAIQYVYTL